MSYTRFSYSYSDSPQSLLSPDVLSSCYECAGASPSALVHGSHHAPVTEPSYGNDRVKEHETYRSYGVDSTCLYSLEKIPAKSGPGNIRDSHGHTRYLPEPPSEKYQYESCELKPVDVNGRRKNATKETTSTLKTWLQEHKKNPYPTKGEKIMLAIITKMTLTQVSTWFANARRRLKKENKMTWCPRNKTSEERCCDEDVHDAAEHVIRSERTVEGDRRMDDADLPHSDLDDFDLTESDGSESERQSWLPMSTGDVGHLFRPAPETSTTFNPPAVAGLAFEGGGSGGHEKTSNQIWSLARTAESLQHPDYPACSSQGMTAPSADCRCPDPDVKRVDSPVTSLRNWVDEMFHGPSEELELTEPPSS